MGRSSMSSGRFLSMVAACAMCIGLFGCAGSGDSVDAGPVGRSAAGTRSTGIGASLRAPLPAASEMVIPRLDGSPADTFEADRDGSGMTKLDLGRISPAVRGVSGVVASTSDPNLFWVHSRLGRGPRVFAVDRGGRVVGSLDGYRILGVGNAGWSDISTVPAVSGRRLLAVADTDNAGRLREDVFVYGLEEPAVRTEIGPEELQEGAETETAPVPNAFRTSISLPARRFHSEAFYWDSSGPVFFSRVRGMVVLFRADGSGRFPTFAELTPRGALKVDENPVGADKGEHGVLLLTDRALWLFEPPVSSGVFGSNIFRGRMYRLTVPVRSWTGVCFSGETVVLIDIDGRFSVVSLESLRQNPVMRE